jgi:hypothetical protein
MMQRRLVSFLIVLTMLALLTMSVGCSSYVRLRGSPEIHDPDCRLVDHAPDDGVVDASFGDGPPCFECLREEAIEWAEDQ